MARPKGYNPKLIASMVGILASHPEGLWIRRLAKEAKLHPSTVTRYIGGPLKSLVETSALGSPDSKPLLVVVRLKSLVFQRLAEGASLSDVIRLLGLLDAASK